MKPEGKSYEEPVIIPKVWELINGEHHLVPEKVSAYIRELEGKLADAPSANIVQMQTHRLPNKPHPQAICESPDDCQAPNCMCLPKEK